MQSINRPTTTLSLLLAIGILILSVQTRTSAEPQLLNAVVAVVFETPITVDDIKIETAPLEEELFRQFSREPANLQQKINELRQSALENLIERELIINEFQSAGYTMPEGVIDERVQERIRRQFGDRLTLTKTLKAKGITYESYRTGIRRQIIVEALTAQNVNSVVLVSPYEIERNYQENLEL